MSLFVNKVVDERGTSYSLTTPGYGALVAIILILLILACYLTGENKRIQTKPLVFAAVAMALGMITSFLKLFEAPMGGSDTGTAFAPVMSPALPTACCSLSPTPTSSACPK